MDEQARALERELAANPTPDARLRFAHLFERHGRGDDALDVLLGGVDDPAVRREVATRSSWGELEAHCRFIDAAPLVEDPVIAWNVPLARGHKRLRASLLEVLQREGGAKGATRIFDPQTGARRPAPGRLEAPDRIPLSADLAARLLSAASGVTILDRKTSKKRATIGDGLREPLVDADGLVGSDERSVVACDLSGRVRWHSTRAVWPSALLPGRVLAVDGSRQQLVVLDRATGQEMVSFAVPNDWRLNTPVAVARDVIYVGDGAGMVTALTPAGDTLWALELPSTRPVIELAAVHRRLYVACGKTLRDTALVALWPAGENAPPGRRSAKRAATLEPRRPGDRLYASRETYRFRDAIYHPAFGRGEVVAATPTKIDVVFPRPGGRGEVMRTFVHTRGS